MKTNPRLRALALPLCALSVATVAWAQTAPSNATPAQLAKYDTNKNGRLDPNELAAMQADEAKAASAATSGSGDESDKPLQLSPFSVSTTKDSGYFAENTLAGSRLNTNLADLAASVTVVTKQQMEDTAALDINDVFKYEASTEGSSTYSPSIVDRGTVKDTNAGYTFGNDGTTTTNAQSNRIRGLTAPDAAVNNYSTNNRIPFDAYNTQSIEISRGPNSLLFGLGTPSGVVNVNTAQAALNRDTNTVTVRTDDNGSFRSSLAFNRGLIKDKLAIYGAYLYDDRQFERKPSRDLYRRYYGTVTFKPFKNTVIRAMAEDYHNDANRPNSFTPRDQVTPWLQSGRPIYDPVTRMVTFSDGGRTLGPYVSNVNSPGYNAAVNTVLGGGAINTIGNPLFVPGLIADDTARPLRRIDNGAIVDMFARQPQFYAPAQTNPATATPTPASLGWVAQDPRYAILDRLWTASNNLPQPVPVVNGQNGTYGSWNFPGVTNKAIYDWTKYNTLQTNFAQIHATNLNLEFEQQILPNLFFSAGWLRQDIDERDNYTINQLQGATLAIDTNKNMPDGTPNPYVGLPFIFEGAGGGLDTYVLPETDDNYRAMLAYDLDLTKNNNWTKWIGRHRILGLWQEQDVRKQADRWRMNFVSGDADATLRYVANATTPGLQFATGSPGSSATMRHYYMASPGAPQATVTHSLGFYGNQGQAAPFTSSVRVWNYNTNQFQNDSITESVLYTNAGSNQGTTQREVKGTQIALQSYLWEDRFIGTFGWRRDNYRARISSTGALTDINGTVTEPAVPNSAFYVNGVNGIVNYDLAHSRFTRWDKLSGSTKTLGGAFRPLKDIGFAKRAGGGEGSLGSEFLQSLTFYYNTSDNFNPPLTYQTDYFKKPLPKPTGKGKDGGIGFHLFNNKLVARINWYETENNNERTAAAGTLLTRAIYSDTTTGLAWASAVQRIRNALAAGRTLNPNTADPNSIFAQSNWNSDQVWNVSDEANQRKIYDLIQLPYRYYDGVSSGATQDSRSKGTELQLTFNPAPNWTMKITGSKDQATYKNIAPQYDAWIAERMPKWTTSVANDIPDFVDPNNQRRWSLKQFWTGYGFTNVALAENNNLDKSPQGYFNDVVLGIVANAKALEGAVSPLQRIYHASFLTNYVFTNDNFGGKLKGWSIGGSERWESKAAIGYYGKASDPNQPALINTADITRPVWGDDGNYYTDVWVAYSRKIWNNRIGMKIQLNVNDVFESGRLLPTQVNFDGSPWAFRIIDPRQFILQSTFTF